MNKPIKFGIGQAVTRKEDDRLLRGAGHYVADHLPADVLHGIVVRSPHARARFRMDASNGAACPACAWS